ncbi:MAG: hypothetical protein ABI193_22615 [Minicystis sp.]
MSAALVAVSAARADVPPTLTEQGRLFDNAGAPINASISITFAMYATAAGGAPLFTTAVNGGWHNVSTRGPGVNNSGQNCSMRAFESVNAPVGWARACDFRTAQTVRL